MNRASLSALFFSLLFIFIPLFVHADDTSDIQAQIDEINQQKAALDAEIAEDQKQLDALGAKAQTYQSAIAQFDLSQKQLSAQISSTEKSISATNLELEQLGGQIGTTQDAIDLEKSAVASSLRDIQTAGDQSVIEQVFGADTLTDAWTAIEADKELATTLQGHTQSLSSAKDVLTTHQTEVNQTKQQLTDLDSQLASQNKQLAASKAAEQQLLDETQNDESGYQALIATKQAQEKTFEQTLANLQAQLTPVSATAVPHPGSGILTWPVSASFMAGCPAKASALGNNFCITQFFGNTPFATANPQIYNGMGHDGIDIGMPIGTPVLAALSGTVIGTGNTDLVYDSEGDQCLSFGKWVMLEHANGLDTLYAHLSSIEVTKGDTLSTGQELGLSGMTGYATGPHLHFGVYASAGVEIMDLGQFRGSGGTPCTDGGAVIPVAPNNAYLNPMSYL